jgi:calpain-7
MQAAKTAKTPAERVRLGRRCGEVIALGERLKANAGPPVPESTRPLTTSEKAIIWRASRLHGSLFPPWESAPDPAVFTDTGPGGTAYVCVGIQPTQAQPTQADAS